MPPRRIKLKRTDIWREGKWLDLWSVVHFLSGASTALLLSRLSFPFIPTLVIAILIFIAYELWEAAVQIAETPQNRIMDVVVGTLSFLLTYAGGLTNVRTHNFIALAVFVVGINILLATFGWYASQKAIALEKKMRHGMNVRRAKLEAARDRLLRRRRHRHD